MLQKLFSVKFSSDELLSTSPKIRNLVTEEYEMNHLHTQ